MPLPSFFRWCLRWLFRGVAVALFVALPATLIYLREVGFGPGVRQRIAQAIGRDSARIQIGRLTIDPFRGLVARNVDVFAPGSASPPISQIRDIVLSLNLAQLFRGKIVVDALQLNGSAVSLPIEGGRPDGPRIKLRDVNAQLILIGDQARLTRFEGDLEGIRISLSGLVKNPLALRLPSQRADSHRLPQRRQAIAKFLNALRKIRFPGRVPEIRAEVSGDLADLKTLHISPITLRSGPVQGPDWRIEGMEIDAEFTGNAFTIQHLMIKDRAGQASGWARFRDGAWTFEAASSLDPELLRGLVPKDSPLAGLRFGHRPQLEVRGSFATAEPKPRVDLTGSMDSGPLAYRNVPVENFVANFAWKEGGLFVQDIRLNVAGGEAQADILYQPGDFRCKISSTVSPAALAGMFDEKVRQFLEQFEFRDAPQMELDLRGKSPNFTEMVGTGWFKLGRTALRGIWIDSGESTVAIADRAVTYRNLRLQRGKCTGTGTLTYDFGRREIRMQDIRSTFPPVDVMTWSDPKMAEVLKPYRFHEPPLIHADGLVHMKDPTKNRLFLTVDAPEGMDYDLLERTLDFQSLSGKVSILGTTLKLDIGQAALFGGNVAVKADISIDAHNPTYTAETTVTRVNFAKLTKLYFDYDDSLGVGSGTFRYTTRMGKESAMRGEGNIVVEDGNVFAIPLLGPLSEIIAKIIPGVGYQNAHLATANFRVADGKITTNNLEIQGTGFSLYGYGDISFVTDKMDMSVRINAQGIPGVVLFPVSKLFEYVSTGTVSDPEWRPKIIPRFVEKDAGKPKTPPAR